MKFIELTTKDGKKVMVNLDNVTHILDCPTQSGASQFGSASTIYSIGNRDIGLDVTKPYSELKMLLAANFDKK